MTAYIFFWDSDKDDDRNLALVFREENDKISIFAGISRN